MAEKGSTGFFSKILHPYPFLETLSSDRYRSLKIQMLLIINALALIPLLLAVVIGFFWLRSIIEEDLHRQVTSRVEAARRAMVFFLASSGDDDLSDQGRVRTFFSSFTREFGGMEGDDVFLTTGDGMLQTPSRFFGDRRQRLPLGAAAGADAVTVVELELPDGSPALFGSAPVRGTPVRLGVVVASSVDAKLYGLMKKKLSVIYLLAALVALGIVASFRLSHTLVNSIKEADQQKEAAIAESEHANKLASIGRLSTGIAHEINNPLAIINEKAGLMKDLIELSGEEFSQKEKFLALINGIFESVTRCRTITHRLLGFARKMEVVNEVVDLNDAIKEVIGFLEKELLYRSIRLELRLLPSLPRIQSDKAQLQQVLLNLINNALDAVADGGAITVSTGVKNTRTVRVAVRDDGHGIPRDKLKHIFDPFFTTKEKGKGTGLGLAISYGIMKKLGGDILVESREGAGATFTIEIPVIAPTEKGAGA